MLMPAGDDDPDQGRGPAADGPRDEHHRRPDAARPDRRPDPRRLARRRRLLALDLLHQHPDRHCRAHPALRICSTATSRSQRKARRLGLALLSPGLALLIFGLAERPARRPRGAAPLAADRPGRAAHHRVPPATPGPPSRRSSTSGFHAPERARPPGGSLSLLDRHLRLAAAPAAVLPARARHERPAGRPAAGPAGPRRDHHDADLRPLTDRYGPTRLPAAGLLPPLAGARDRCRSRSSPSTTSFRAPVRAPASSWAWAWGCR